MNEQEQPTIDRSKYAKIMVNLHLSPKNRTRYVKMLEKVSSDPYVTYMKMLVSLGLGTLVVLCVIGILLTSPLLKLQYIAIWVLLAAGGCLALVVMYALPARGMSLLAALSNLTVTSRLAMLLARKSPKLPCLGIDRVKNDRDGYAVLRFTNGDVGRCMKVSGCIGLSTLPAIAESIAQYRYNYLIARKHTTQELLVTTVRQAMFTSQLEALRKLHNEALTDSDNPDNQWRAFMTNQLYEYIFDTMRGDDTIIEQWLILREVDAKGLSKAMAALENAVIEGMYSSCELVSADEFIELTRIMTSSHFDSRNKESIPVSAYE